VAGPVMSIANAGVTVVVAARKVYHSSPSSKN